MGRFETLSPETLWEEIEGKLYDLQDENHELLLSELAQRGFESPWGVDVAADTVHRLLREIPAEEKLRMLQSRNPGLDLASLVKAVPLDVTRMVLEMLTEE